MPEAKRRLDPIVGDLSFVNFWELNSEISFGGKRYAVPFAFEGEEEDEIDEGQKRAFLAFNRDSVAIMAAVERATLDHYLGRLESLRRMFGPDADALAPRLAETDEIGVVVTPTSVWFPRDSQSTREMALLFDCSWDPGHGLAARVVDSEVVEVGPQDIVL